MSLDYINPMTNLYKEFLVILQKIVIKYNYLADTYETVEMTRKANEYLDAVEKKDTFFTYRDYTYEDFDAVKLFDYDIRKKAVTDIRAIPVDNYNEKTGIGTQYRQKLLELRRKKVIEEYEEQNNYYRMLNGQPDTDADPRYFFYVTDEIAEEYGIDPTIPIHELQDYYNNLDPDFPDHGDQIMAILEGIGYIDTVKNASREKRNLIYGGSICGGSGAMVTASLTTAARAELGITSMRINLTNDASPITGYKANENLYYNAATISSFAGLDIQPGDWVMSTGSKWKKVDSDVDIQGESDTCEGYLNYLGSQRISILTARKAKNFEILRLDKNLIRTNVYDTFVDIYNQCRDYMVTVVYQYDFRSFMSYYDNFIAMCIMLMAELHLITKQIPYEVRRNFFDVYALRMLYEAYNMPYDIYVDIDTQNLIAQNLNMIIINKATNKVIYDVANLLGFSNLTAYKYYLAKQHKLDPYGNPIFKTTERFNTDTGELETVPDYDTMYDIYFQKEELMEDDFIQSFNSKVNRVEYNVITPNDAFWWEDQNLIDRKNETDYNFVESKYLSLGLSYKMTDVLFENVILLKTVMYYKNELSDISISLPKIITGAPVPLFDAIILLICLVSKKHNLTGEIISIPTDIISVLDYLNNMESSRGLVDTFAFDFDYFKTDEGQDEIEKVKECLGKIAVGLFDSTGGYYVFDDPTYSYYNSFDEKVESDISTDVVAELMKMGELTTGEVDVHGDDVDLFEEYISVLSLDSVSGRAEKIETLNKIYTNIKGLYKFLNEKMIDASDKETYDTLRTFYNAAFYAKEVKDIFTIQWRDSTGETHQRTAKNFFEYLYYKNRSLYLSIFYMDFENEYDKFLNNNTFPTLIHSTSDNPDSLLVIDDDDNMTGPSIKLSEVQKYVPNARVGDRVEICPEPTYAEFTDKLNAGLIDVSFDVMKEITEGESNNESAMSATIYYYVNHIISKFKNIVDNIDYSYMLNDVSTLLQDLLIKLIKFVKSFTVDFIGLDIIFVCDFKPENLLRLIDKVHYIEKTIEPKETMNFSFWDTISVTANKTIYDRNKLRDNIAKPWFTDPDNSTDIPSRRGMIALFDSTSTKTDLSIGYSLSNVDESNGNMLLNLYVPRAELVDDSYNINYDDYTNNPSSYKGIIPTITSNDAHSVIPDSYAYTVYLICKTDDIDDVTGFPDAGQGPSVRFLSTPLVDIYSGLGTTTLNIREFVPSDSNDTLSNDHVEILTNKDAREWHIIALSQTSNTVRVFIDGERCLDHTFNQRSIGDGTTNDFQCYTMPNNFTGKGFKDVLNGYSYYSCGIQFKMMCIANVNHNGAELQENSKWFAHKYGIQINNKIPIL